MPSTLERIQHGGQGRTQGGGQGVRRVDDEHAAGRQARLPLGRAYVQRGVKPAAPRLIGQGLEAARQAVRC